MNLKILFMLLLYYGVISLVFSFGSDYITGYSSTVNLNSSDITEEETATGIFDVLPELGRFIGFVGFGIGLPEDTPTWFSTTFAIWQTLLLIFTVGFIVSSIWDG